MAAIERKIRLIRWRMRFIRILHRVIQWIFWGCVAASVLVIVERLAHLGLALPAVLSVAGGVLLLGAVLTGLLKPATKFEAALLADENLGLRERLSSAILLPKDRDHPMIEALHLDAEHHARRVKARHAVPIRWPRETKLMVYPLTGFLLLLAFLPELDFLGSRDRRVPVEIDEEMESDLERLQEVVREVQEQAPDRPEQEPLRELAEKIYQLADEIRLQQIEEREAMARLSTLADQLDSVRKELQDKMGLDRKRFESEEFDELGAFAESMESMDLDAAMSELSRLLKKLESGELSESEQEALSREMENLSNMVSDQALSRLLSETAKRLRQGETRAASEALHQAQKRLGSMKEDLAQLSRLDQAKMDMEIALQAMKNRLNQDQLSSLERQIAQIRLQQQRQKSLENLAQQMLQKRGQCPKCQGQGKCSKCQGTAVCATCQGTGMVDGKPCPDCQGSGQCQSCSGTGVCSACNGTGMGGTQGMGGGPRFGETSQPSSGGMMGPGSGRGGRMSEEPNTNQVNFVDQMVAGQHVPGRILGYFKQRGPQVRGDAPDAVHVEFLELRQQAEKAVTREPIPLGKKDHVLSYLEAITPRQGAPDILGAPDSGPAAGD